ncbi:U-scoloptoxin(01)-Er1a-like [Homarus americanus]|uniref:U-scoloptoxin(01)-Er1a-like n=1 Tax=Homarus americanus TaxID=6706 RepID=UPI001C46E1F3|nr:U-scoloptoxin(01)-Er1a-like [Homarus americanus]
MRWLGQSLATLTVVAMVVGVGNTAVADYSPDSPPQVYDYRCQSTDNDPDADCIFGIAGQDYPTLRQVPDTKFTCVDLLPGIYADPDAACQVYHMCLHDGHVHSFLCPNGTVFHQEYFICDLWFNVDCNKAVDFYFLNEYIYKDPEPKEIRISYV